MQTCSNKYDQSLKHVKRWVKVCKKKNKKIITAIS